MDISRYYDSTALVQREAYVAASTVKKTFVTHIASVKCNIQPQSAETGQLMPGMFGKQFIMFCANQDIAEGDKVIVGGVTYGVAGVETFTMSRNPHMELVLTVFKN